MIHVLNAHNNVPIVNVMRARHTFKNYVGHEPLTWPLARCTHVGSKSNSLHDLL